MPEIQTVDRASLDRFIADLVEAGFTPISPNGRTFEGPLHPALADETRATTMCIEIRDGWPFVHPAVRVDGLKPSVHLTGRYMCLWRQGDDSYGWLRLETLNERIARWAQRYRGRATEDDPVLDPQLYWLPYNAELLATVELRGVPYGNGGSGDLRAERHGPVLKIGTTGQLRVRWYGRDEMAHPPANLDMIAGSLKPDQAANLRDELEHLGRTGGADIVMVVWNTPAGEPNALVLGVSRERRGTPVKPEAYEVARIDPDTLLRRAGPDAAMLADKLVVVFGQGAIGSHVTDVISRTGVGGLRLVDSEKVRPGDVVRHAVPREGVGLPKAGVMAMLANGRSPWLKAEPHVATWSPDGVRALLAGCSLAIDAVNEESFTAQLSRITASAGPPLLSVALYRGGSVARARVHVLEGVPIHERTDSSRFPVIPPGPLEQPLIWETGCASPVNNAPPTAVASAAALAGRVAVDVLVGRQTGSFDFVEVYRPLGEKPFDAVGSLWFGA